MLFGEPGHVFDLSHFPARRSLDKPVILSEVIVLAKFKKRKSGCAFDYSAPGILLQDLRR